VTIEERATAPDLIERETPAGPSLAAPVHAVVANQHATLHAPELIGLDALDAHAIARDSGLRLSVSVWESSVGPWGRVLEQQPTPGSRIRRGGRVKIVVSGRPFLPLPDVTGMTMGEAIEQLCWLGFVPIAGARRASHSVPPGHIICSRPAAGELAAHGTVVALEIAKPERGVSSRS
jgi:beta-lactam-binding protein with PASTA domain